MSAGLSLVRAYYDSFLSGRSGDVERQRNGADVVVRMNSPAPSAVHMPFGEFSDAVRERAHRHP